MPLNVIEQPQKYLYEDISTEKIPDFKQIVEEPQKIIKCLGLKKDAFIRQISIQKVQK